MKQLKKDLKAVTEELKKLTQKADRMIKKVDTLSKTPTKKRAKSKAPKDSVAKKAKKVSSSGTVLSIITKNRQGINVALLKGKTGFGGRKVNDIVHRLKKEGKIKSGGRGIYVRA